MTSPRRHNDDGRTFHASGYPIDEFPQIVPGSRNLQRNAADPARALIGDPRNDENVIVSQLQGLWHRFHNKVAMDNPSWVFPRVQQEVRFHYQWMLLHDFLHKPSSRVLEQVLPVGRHPKLVVDKGNLRFFHYKETAFMPLEFSAAAYRFGHSMVRPLSLR